MGNQLPAGWAFSKVESIAELLRGISYKKEQARNTSEMSLKPILRANNINGDLNFESLVYVPEELISEDQSIRKDDIVFAMSSGSKHLVGKSARAISDFDGSYGAFCGLVRPSNFICKPYLYYAFQENSFRSLISQVAKGSNINNLKREHILHFAVRLAPLNEQQRIVAKIEELFSELDNGIAALKTAREQLKVYRQAVLKHAFEGKLTAKWREENADKLETPEQLLACIQQEREARYQQQLEEWKAAVKAWEANGKEGKKPGKPTLPKDSELNIDLAPLTLWELPLGWRWLKLSDLLQSSPQNGLYKPASDYGLGCQIIRIDNFYDGSVVNNETLKRLSVTDDEKKTYGLQLDDLIVNRVNSIEYLGKSALIRRLNEPTVFESNIMRCSLVDSSISNEYVTFYLNSKSGRKELCKNAKHAVNQASINQTDVGNAFVPICSIEEQQLIVLVVSAKLDAIGRTITDIELQLRQSETLRQSILKKAFSGQLVPQDPNDEPASELLARIQAEKAAEKAAQKASANPKAAAKSGAKRGRKSEVLDHAD